MRLSSLTAFCVLISVACSATAADLRELPKATKPVDFNFEIRPILADKCFKCHGPDVKARAAELRLDTRDGAFRQHEGSAPFVPGKPDKSEAFLRITATDPDERMPPKDSGLTLTPAQIDSLKRWIEQGANWQEHWSFNPVKQPDLPAIKDKAWPINPIDHFILAKLEERGLKPSPVASRETLIRRLSLDLTGVPPTPEEVDAFLADKSPQAYEKIVDRLLASPRFGQTQTLYWLDAARYADTNGYQRDGRRFMYFWRDWVVKAFNNNMPFDQFTIEQLAGDMLPNPSVDQKVATGFNRNHRLNGEGGAIPEESRTEYVMDRAETTGTVWLGLTMNCCRCHDHKYDPLAQVDFYRMYALFNNVPEDGKLTRFGSAKPWVDFATPKQDHDRTVTQKGLNDAKAAVEAYKKRIEEEKKKSPPGTPLAAVGTANAIPATGASAGTSSSSTSGSAQTTAAGTTTSSSSTATSSKPPVDKELERLEKEVVEARKRHDDVEREIPFAMIMEELPKPRETFVLDRGDYEKPTKTKVDPGVPSRLLAPGQTQPRNRLEFARWLVDPRNPLTSRVTVNRFWQQFFGQGFVKTSEDYGTQGDRPSHPELLDWLAGEFIRNGWNTKQLFKLIVMSNTYRQSSELPPALKELDPENRLLARGARYRLASATLRDQALFVSGLLVEKMGGPSVRPYQPPGVWEALNLGPGSDYIQDHGENLYRRSLYIFWRRTIAPTMLFDVGQRQICEVRSKRTNTPLQSLALLNDVTFVEASRKLAERVMKTGGMTPESQLTLAFRWATSRQPRPAELQILVSRYQTLFEQYRRDPESAKKLLAVGEAPADKSLDPAKLAAQTAIASVLLNLDETITRE